MLDSLSWTAAEKKNGVPPAAWVHSMHHQSPSLPKSLLAAIRKFPARYMNPEVDQTCTTIASYNVHKCVGTDGRFDPGRIAAVVAEIDADLIALQEADERFGSKEGLLDLDWLEKNASLVRVDERTDVPSHGWHGNVILARERAVSHVRRLRLPGLEPRGALIVDLDLKGVPLRIIAAHLGLLRRSRSQQASALLEATHSAQRATILMGDLNEWRVRNRSSLLGLMPHFGPVHAAVPSFPSRYPLLALDRILASPHHLISSIDAHDSPLARAASDHLPIKARLDLATARKQIEALNAAE